MATSNGSTAIRDKILASLARYRALRIGKFPCAFWRLSSRPGLTAKVCYALLCNPGLVNAAYRDIAQIAEVALGTVGWVIRDLVEMGLIVDMGERGRRLKNRKKLLERWLIAYPEQLRPKLETERYRALDPDWWQTAPLHNLQAYWGGEVAADRLTHYLIT